MAKNLNRRDKERKIKISDSEIEIIFRIVAPFELSPRGGILQHRWQRLWIAFVKSSFGDANRFFWNLRNLARLEAH